MHGSIALPCRARQPHEGGRLGASPLQTQSLRKQCHYPPHQQELSPYNPSSLRSMSPSRGEYDLRCIAEDADVTSCYGVSHCPGLDRFSRPMSPISHNFNAPSPFPRSSSRGSSQSYQSSSADDSGREGGASSSGIGLSGSSAVSSRRASSCSSGTGGSRLTYKPATVVGGNSSGSLNGSLDSRLNLNGSELTVKSVALRNERESGSLCRYSDGINAKSEEDVVKVTERTQSMDSIENELICPICLELFRDPVLLPCAHNLCAACAEQLSQSSQALGQSPDFHCPACREPARLDERGVSVLRHNMTLQNIVDGYRRAAAASVTSQGIATCSDFDVSSGDESSASNQSDGTQKVIRPQYVHLPRRDTALQQGGKVFCQFCEDEPPRLAIKTCVTCRAYYCERCLRLTHPRKKPFINHKLVPATPGSAGTLSHPSPGNRRQTLASCSAHPQAEATLFCWSCDSCLCRVCGSNPVHIKHSLTSVAERADKEKADLEAKVCTVEHLKKSQERYIERIFGACRETEMNAESQEAQLQAECDALIRIIQGRKDAISNKIRETKTLRLRQLSQKANEAESVAEMCSSALDAARKALLHSTDFDLLHKHCRSIAERLDEILPSSCNSLPIENELIPPRFCFQFSNEKAILERLDIIEAPSAPKVCEELCTQSHDKVTVQWRSPDHVHTTSYELQYTVDNLNTSSVLTSSEVKDESWMIVPNIRDCHYTVHGLQSGTRYMFVVKATNEAGSSRSECCPIKTLGIPFAFDAHSMHKKLRLANHGYTATREDTGRRIKESDPTALCCVSANVEIECGRHYWEVVVCQSSSFTIGVAYSDVSRYDWIGKNNSSWCLCRLGGEWSVRHAGKDFPIDMPAPLPKKIGVFLDYDGASFAFFDGASGRHIHTFRPASFQRPLRPAFAIGNKSLTINTGITLPDHLRLSGKTT